MTRPLPILAVQSAPIPGDIAATWAKFEGESRALLKAYPQARLVVWPELYLAALGAMAEATPAAARPSQIAEPIPGPLTARLGGLARELGVWLIPGSIYERGEGRRIHNTALAFSPDGELVARYRKLFPWRPYESTLPGDELCVFDAPGIGRIGLMICYDGWFPEVARGLAWLGAELIVQPTATPTADREQELVLARANAIANQVYLVNVNLGGRGPGRSVIVDPEGRILQQAGNGEEELSEVIDLDTVARVRRFGTAGLNRPWDQLDAEGGGVPLPMYADGRIQPRPSPGSAPPSGRRLAGLDP